MSSKMNNMLENAGRPVVQAYGRGGFIVSGKPCPGPTAIVGGNVLRWHVQAASDISMENLRLFTLTDPPIGERPFRTLSHVNRC